jgi:aminopeptidase Y
MASFYLPVALILLGQACASQYPIFETETSSIPTVDEVVSSKSLQNRIHVDNLLERAKTLYSIAELGEEEYNHPTRVIGSKGIAPLVFLSLNVCLTRL